MIIRALSPAERMWLVADRLCPPFVIQLVLEGQGVLRPDAWRDAVERASETHPGSRAVLQGRLGGCRWVDGGQAPPVRVVTDAAWDGRSPDGAEYLGVSLDPKTGPTTEVVLVGSPTPRVVFRTHHATMDGRGMLTFVEDIFRALRGEALSTSDRSITDLELARRLAPPKAERRGEECPAPTGSAEGPPRGITWRRRFVPGRPSRLLPRVALVVAEEARRHAGDGDGVIRLDVPVDLRGRFPDVRSTANLTGMVHLTVPPEATEETLHRDLRGQLDALRDASAVESVAPVRWIPLWLMTWIGRSAMGRVQRRGRYLATAVLSNLGRVPLERFRGGGFSAGTGFFVAPGNEGAPFILTLTGHAGGVELVLTMPEALASEGRIDGVLDAVVSRLDERAADRYSTTRGVVAAVP